MRRLLALLVLAATVPLSQPAHAASTDVVVTGAAGSVTVTRSPFHLSVRDTTGRTVLAEVANPQAPPTAYVSEDPATLGSSIGSTAPLYAPLTVTVGQATTATYPGTFFEGNLLVGAVTGVQFSAVAVTAVIDIDGGKRLTVSTNDPTGRTLTVDITAVARHFHIAVTSVGGTGTALIGDAFASSTDEAFHGFGGNHEGVDKRGQTFETWVQEENFGAGPLQPGVNAIPGTSGPAYLFPNGPGASYYVIPETISNHGYGLLLDQPELARWRLDSDRADAWSLQVASSTLTYDVAPGDGLHAIDELTSMTGRHQLPPDWALGPQLDRLIYTGDSASSYEAKVRDDIAKIKATGLPLTAYRIEGWGVMPTATVKELIGELHAMGIHVLLYFRAYSAEDGGNTEMPTVFTDALTHGYFSTTAAGTPYVFGSPFGAGVAGLVDVTNPAAAAWYAARLTAALDLGADGFMNDFGEQVTPDMHFADGQTGATMHNTYPVLYEKLIADTIASYAKTHPGRTFFRYDRAGYTGSARYEVANFPGDETTDWSASSGLASQTPDMLSRGIGGAYGYTTDIGGYEDATTGATTKELFLRWAEWAALSPLFRDHGSAMAGTHTPYSYDAQTLATYIALSKLHEQAAPLIKTLWQHADTTGEPITRPLWLAYPDDPTAAQQDQEWLLGPDVLVAPVVTQGATTREVYLPDGCWTYQPTGTSYTGHRSVTVAAPLTTLAYFFHCQTHPFSAATAAAHPRPNRAKHPSPTARAPANSLAATGGDPGLAILAAVSILVAAGVAHRPSKEQKP